MFFLGSKRRVLGIIVGLIIIIGLLSGCGSEDATDEPTITVSVNPGLSSLS